MKRILSIDGGGIRGIIPGMFLVALEERIQKATDNPDARLADYFDFFAGTSTGGILLSLLLCPMDDNPTKPRFTAKEAVDLYLNHGSEIFAAKPWRHFLSKFGLLSELYDETVLEHILAEYFGDRKLSQLIRPCIITAYNIELRKNHLFRQQKAITHGDSRDFYLKDVCRATSAAPTYFSVAEIFSLAKTRFPLIDGGVFAHNPALSALLEVIQSYNTYKIHDIAILSLGTGISKTSYNYEDFKKKWAISIGPALVDIMGSSSAESVNYYLEQLFQSVSRPQNYIRIEPTDLSSINPSMDSASPNNIQKIIALADKLISEKENQINQIVAELVHDKKVSTERSVWSFLKN
ncbi:patatin-like phospholipase family protein [Sphingobacterium sp. UT-1RO-CII-1]|uniref:patatin-like phospholipase family protein n=1 Tax=Sphingobacterium sp. UT-1RO-CII-1 TaxID=2995225 RepID=UPI00227AA8FC|nr:patatin-like phospholipase family protein [Sphingobacterium sp. UT-1RO-CII-1]MCY4779205.1 patatin-like phospholipase family protein [Sphingobacterium sp. UT-1RO-CII-1]